MNKHLLHEPAEKVLFLWVGPRGANGMFDMPSPKIPYYLTNSQWSCFVEVAGYGGNANFVSASDGSVPFNTIIRTQQGQASTLGTGPVDFVGYPNVKLLAAGYGITTFSGTADDTWRTREYIYEKSGGQYVWTLQFVNAAGDAAVTGPTFIVYPDGSWVSGTTDLAIPAGAPRIKVQPGQNLEVWGDTIWFKDASAAVQGYMSAGDLRFQVNGKGVVLKNAAGTVTKRVRLNDTGDGLVFENPWSEPMPTNEDFCIDLTKDLVRADHGRGDATGRDGHHSVPDTLTPRNFNARRPMPREQFLDAVKARLGL